MWLPTSSNLSQKNPLRLSLFRTNSTQQHPTSTGLVSPAQRRYSGMPPTGVQFEVKARMRRMPRFWACS